MEGCPITRTPDELHSQYACIFPSGNRNSASHKWSTHILHHAPQLTEEEIRSQFASFCPVSGSPISQGRRGWEEEFVEAGGEVRYCCWPCSCDMRDAVKEGRVLLHTSKVEAKEGEVDVTFLSMKDLCGEREAASYETVPVPSAPDFVCLDGKLKGGTHLKQGYVVIGAVSSPSSDSSPPVPESKCEKRRGEGFGSGMGDIFRRVSGVSSYS